MVIKLNIHSKKNLGKFLRIFYKISPMKINEGEKERFINVKIFRDISEMDKLYYLNSEYSGIPMLKKTIDNLRLKYGDI